MRHPFLADVGVPMIFIEWPLMLCALVPIIIIETEILRRRLSLTYGKALAGAARANIISSVVGVPLAWGVMLAVEFATLAPIVWAAQKWHWKGESPLFYVFYLLGIAWTGPPGTSFWPVALAAALLLIPTFFASVWLERRSCRRSWPDINPVIINRSVWSANVWSYALLFALGCGWVGWEIYKGDEKAPPVKRLIQEHPIDLADLHDPAIPCTGADARQKFLQAVAQLETSVADFEALMHDVETGKVAVKKNLSAGGWETHVTTADTWTFVLYSDRVGPVRSVQKHPNKGRAIYMFMFNDAGYITRADLPNDGFDFDDTGRLRHWHGDKADCWAKPRR